jgi:hypothetical protein
MKSQIPYISARYLHLGNIAEHVCNNQESNEKCHSELIAFGPEYVAYYRKIRPKYNPPDAFI